MKIVTLCGSTKFKKTFIDANFQETMRGNIVLSVGFYPHANNITITVQKKNELDKLHLKKIDMSDEILVLNVHGYIGNSTRKEIAHAIKTGKLVRYWVQ